MKRKQMKNETVSFLNLVDLSYGFEGIPIYITIYVLLFGVCAVVGVLGNTTVILTILLSKELRKNRNAFLVGLAFADLLVSGVTMPSSISGVLLGKRYFDENSTLCVFSAVICSPGCVASMYSIASIAVSRYYYIGDYATYLKYFALNRILAYIGSIWLLSFLVHLPNHFGWGSPHYSSMFHFCTLDTDLLSYALFYASVLVIAIVITFIFYALIYKTLRNSKLAKNMITGRQDTIYGPSREATLKNELKIVKASFKIFIMFFLAWLPVSILILIHLNEKVPAWAYLYTALLAHCNSTLNFIIYFLEDDTFRNVFKKCFVKFKKLHTTRVHQISMDSRFGNLAENSRFNHTRGK